MARSYRDLLVWQKAKTLAVRIYRNTESFPRSEIYGLTSQLRRNLVLRFLLFRLLLLVCLGNLLSFKGYA